MNVVVRRAVWKGTEAEALLLVAAIENNCTCSTTAEGAKIGNCPPHLAMFEDQRFCDGLVYARHLFAVHEPDAAKRVIEP